MTHLDSNDYSIHTLKKTELSAGVETLAESFQNEPNHEFFYSSESTRQRALRLEFTAGLRDAMRHGSVHVVKSDNSIVGVSVWLKPYSFPITWRRKLRGLTIFARIALLDSQGLKRVGKFTIELEDLHPRQPYWYMMAIGVDPTHQGMGIGSALVEQGLSKAEKSSCPCRLETTSSKNVDWYSKFGFSVVDDKVVLVDEGPPIFTMHWDGSIPNRSAMKSGVALV